MCVIKLKQKKMKSEKKIEEKPVILIVYVADDLSQMRSRGSNMTIRVVKATRAAVTEYFSSRDTSTA